jgi:hypothetical protein
MDRVELARRGRLREAARAAFDLHQLCAEPEGWLPPQSENRDAAWEQGCAEAAAALPVLLQTLEWLEERHGPQHRNSDVENSLTIAAMGAAGTIALANGAGACGSALVGSLIDLLERPESKQNMRINYRAARLLGELGQAEAAPALVRAMFLRSQGRAGSLAPVARLALQQLDDPHAVAEALVRAGRLGDEGLNERQAAEPGFDIRDVKEQVALTLGLLGVTTPAVTAYLTAELEHDDLDEVDRQPPRGAARYTPELSRVLRRGLAAEALGRLRHMPSLDLIASRLMVQPDGRMTDQSVDINEIPRYIESLGYFLYPEDSTRELFEWAERGAPPLRERAVAWLVRLGDQDGAGRLAALAESWPPCPQGQAQCLKVRVATWHVPLLQSCQSMNCWLEQLADDAAPAEVKDAAVYHLALLARDDGWRQERVRAALLAALPRAGRGEVDALVHVLDQVSPQGCDGLCQQVLETYVRRRQRGDMLAAEARTVAALLGRLQGRWERRTQ